MHLPAVCQTSESSEQNLSSPPSLCFVLKSLLLPGVSHCFPGSPLRLSLFGSCTCSGFLSSKTATAPLCPTLLHAPLFPPLDALPVHPLKTPVHVCYWPLNRMVSFIRTVVPQFFPSYPDCGPLGLSVASVPFPRGTSYSFRQVWESQRGHMFSSAPPPVYGPLLCFCRRPTELAFLVIPTRFDP